MNKKYIGDGVYVEFDGYQVWLSLDDGTKIALNCETFEELTRYVENMQLVEESTEEEKF